MVSATLTDSRETNLLFSRRFECDALERVDDLFRRCIAAIGEPRGCQAHDLYRSWDCSASWSCSACAFTQLDELVMLIDELQCCDDEREERRGGNQHQGELPGFSASGAQRGLARRQTLLFCHRFVGEGEGIGIGAPPGPGADAIGGVN